MQVLFIHRDFPGQFRHLAAILAADPANRVVAIADARSKDPPIIIEGVQSLKYFTGRAAAATHPFLQGLEAGVRRGQIVASAAQTLRQRGFIPELIIAHPGWGEALYLKEVFPSARVLGYFEFYYHTSGADVGFDPSEPPSFDQLCQVRTLNAVNLLALEDCDRGVSPTMWQHSLHPVVYQPKIAVLHEGIDTARARPNPAARVALPNGRVLAPGAEVVTFVSRELEPYRGFPTFMRALPALLARRPAAEVVIVGGDGTGYGPPLPPGETHRARLLAELGGALDLSRVHFFGKVAYADYLNVLAVSAAHVYLTYPFVLSWSMLEAMATECLIIGSATPPVMEVIEHGRNGLLTDFFDPASLAATVAGALEASSDMRPLRRRARKTVLERYDMASIGVPGYGALIAEMMG